MKWVMVESVGEQVWGGMAEASLRALLLAALGGLLILLLRKRSAAQHAVWTLVMLGMLALPLLRPIIPPARVPVSRPPMLEAVRIMPEPELGVNPVSTVAPAAASVTSEDHTS